MATKAVTVMVDLVREEHGHLHERLLDAVEGRSGTVNAEGFKDEGLEVTVTVEHAALDPFRGYADWLHFYNHHRPHTGIGGLVPADHVHNVTGNYT